LPISSGEDAIFVSFWGFEFQNMQELFQNKQNFQGRDILSFVIWIFLLPLQTKEYKTQKTVT